MVDKHLAHHVWAQIGHRRPPTLFARLDAIVAWFARPAPAIVALLLLLALGTLIGGHRADSIQRENYLRSVNPFAHLHLP